MEPIDRVVQDGGYAMALERLAKPSRMVVKW